MTDLRSPEKRTVYDHVDLTTQLRSQPGIFEATGNLKLNAARFNGVDVGYPIALDYDIVSNSSEGMLTLNTAKLQLGKTPVSIAGTINTNSTPAAIEPDDEGRRCDDGRIGTNGFRIRIAFAPDTKVNGKLNADLKITGTSANPALNGKVAARDLKISSKQVPAARRNKSRRPVRFAK
jgi:autotransporter translocation and assembly factor TamB